MRVTRALAALCAGVGCACWLACGGDEPAAPADGGATPAAAQANPDNRPPVIDEVSLTPSRPRPGQTVTAQVVASDPEGETLAFDYKWRLGGADAGNAPELHAEGPRETSIELTVVARDSQGAESDPATAYARIGNLPPTIVDVWMQPVGNLVTAGNDVTATPRAVDPENDELEFRYRWTLNGETVPVDGPTLPAKLLNRGDKIVLEVWASDGDEESEPLESKPIEVTNAAPHVTSTPGAIAPDGVFRYTVRAEDPDGDKTFRYRLVKGPAGMTIGFADGQVEWTPPPDAAGNHDVEISVEDSFGASSSQKFAIQLAYVTEQAPAAQAEGQAAR
jgi:hypothetical protein